MKCPYCDYLDGWDPDSFDFIDGDKGAFYTSNSLNILVCKRFYFYSSYEFSNATIVGCPNCKKIFMEPE